MCRKMKGYYLLRENQEYGPFTSAELNQKTLYHSDLVWIEGESTSWQHPGEIEGLPYASLREKSNGAKPAAAATKASYRTNKAAAIHNAIITPYGSAQQITTTPTVTKPSFSHLREKHSHRGAQKRSVRLNLVPAFFGSLVLLIGVGLSVVVVKDAVMGLSSDTFVVTAEARDIKPIKLQSQAWYTAKHEPPAEAREEAHEQQTEQTTVVATEPTTTTVINAVPANKKERILEDDLGLTMGDKVQIKEPRKIIQVETEERNPDALAQHADNKKAIETTDDKKEKPVVVVKPSKPSLTVSANDYKVGLLGGISNLKITVKNPSSIDVEQATVVVDFLKPNDKTVSSETVTVNNLKAGSAKTIPIPDSDRGVKVRYQVKKIESATL